MDCSSTFQILPLRLGSMTGIWRRQATDIVVIVHFLLFFLFFPLHHPPPLTHSCPSTPDHSPSEVRSHCPADSRPCLRPTLSLPLSTHLHQQEQVEAEMIWQLKTKKQPLCHPPQNQHETL